MLTRYEATGTLICCGTASLEMIQLLYKKFQQFLIKLKYTLQPSNSILKCLPKQNKNTFTKRLVKNIYRSFIHNNPRLETAQVSISSRIDTCAGICVQQNTIQYTNTCIVSSLQRVLYRKEKIANLTVEKPDKPPQSSNSK